MWQLLRVPGFAALLSTQFLGTLNDNLLKMVVTLLAAGVAVGGGSSAYLSLTSVVFVLPYILFAGHAGFVADRFAKRRVLIVAKAAEIVIMALALVALVSGRTDLQLGVLFLAALQAAFVYPAKYGILPEMLKTAELSRANGLMEMSRYAAIIAGTIVGAAMLTLWRAQPVWIGIVLVAVAGAGTLASLAIARQPAAAADKRFQANPWSDIGRGLRRIARDPALWPAVAGIACFDWLCTLALLDTLLLGKEILGLDDARVGLLGAFAGAGLGLGSLAAGRLSGSKVELALVTLGALGLGLNLFLLSQVGGSHLQTAIVLTTLGFSGGLLVVPLNALLQQNAGHAEKGQLIATSNLLSMIGVLLGSAALWLMHDLLRLGPGAIMAVAGAATMTALFALLCVRREFIAAVPVFLHLRRAVAPPARPH